MRFRIRLGKVLFWGAFFLLTSLAGMIGFAYFYVTDGETLGGLIKAHAPRYLPGSQVELGRLRVRPFLGEISLEKLQVFQVVDGTPFLTLRIPWLHIRHDPHAMLKRRFVPREVVVAQPTLRLTRRDDGTWNVQNLLASPWPAPPIKGAPPVLIQNGTVELIDDKASKAVAILREVTIKIEPDGPDVLAFEGSAKGDAFDRLHLKGTVDRVSGRVTLGGDLGHLAVSETLRQRVPAEFRPGRDQFKLISGEVDLQVGRLVYDPRARPALHYEASAQIRSGVVSCPKLPFPINDLSANLSVRNGLLTVERAEGYNGPTTVRVAGGRIALGDPARAPFDLKLVILNLELDKRLEARTPPEFAELWDIYSPGGRISAAVNLVREREGGPVGFAWTVNCLDVSMLFRDFKYPVDHIRGEITCEKKQIRFNVQTLVGNKPLTAKGTIDNPGPYGHVKIDFEGEALPVDKTLLDAIPPDIRKVVQEFNPTGTVGGRAHVERTRTLPTEPPAGKVEIDAYLDLKGDCTMKWVNMPYPVSNLTGQLELHPDRWEFKNIHGTNGQAELTGSGSVNKLPTPPGPRPGQGKGDPLLVDLHLKAKNLPFNDQLYRALPFAWRKSWETLNPVGASDVEARIHIEPGQPDRYHLVVDPRPETLVDLKFTRPPKLPIDPGGTFGLRMEKVKGKFTYDNGLVVMHDVGFRFNGSPVQFNHGKVKVEPDGRFALKVAQVQALDLRLDAELRKMMPPIMAQFAQKIDEGHPIRRIEGNLGLSWAGPGNLVQCDWDHALVVFIDNSILAGVPLEHIQGQLDNVRGKFDGKAIEVHGILRLDSINLIGQQVTALETPFHVERGKAQLSNLKGKLLGGTIEGKFDLTLDATPSYSASLSVVGADLQRYAKTLPGKQTFRGLVFAKLDLSGMGSDLHSLQGRGEAHVKEGDLGELPVLLRLVKGLNRSAVTKTMFDSADVYITIRGGESVLDPIKLTGNAFSLLGEGTMGMQGDLDLRFKPLYGRDRVHVPYVSDMLREASSQFLVIRAQGPIAYPRFSLEPLPYTSDALKGTFRSIGSRRSSRPDSTQ